MPGVGIIIIFKICLMWTYYETEAPWKVCIHYKNLCAGLYPKYAAKNSRPPQLSPAPPYFGGAYGGAAGPPIQKTLAKALRTKKGIRLQWGFWEGKSILDLCACERSPREIGVITRKGWLRAWCFERLAARGPSCFGIICTKFSF